MYLRNSKLPSRILKFKNWRTCTFQGLGAKRQAYLDLLNEGMAKRGFQRVEEIKRRTAWCSLINRSSDLIFYSHKRKSWVGIKSLSKHGNLRVGFADWYYNPIRDALITVFCILLGALGTFFSAYILTAYVTGHPSYYIGGLPDWMIPIPIILFFVVFIGAFLLFFGRPYEAWREQVKAALTEIAESLGGKQITPFKKTTVKLEY
jgi:hypothetical protein